MMLSLKSINYYGKGKSQKTRFFVNIYYKFYDYQDVHDTDVVEFFSAIMCLCGKITLTFLRGPLFHGQGKTLKGNLDFSKIRINLGGQSKSLCQKQDTDFMCKFCILKCLSLLQVNLSNCNPEERLTPFASNSKLLVYPISDNNDKTDLKPAMEFDPVTKRNFALTIPVDLTFVKEHDPPDPQTLTL